MADEIRRSGRATKGQHTKDREDSAPAAAKKGKGAKGKKAKAQPEPEDEEEDEYIRCVCGEYSEDEEGRTMICCDKCGAWQHNDCMGLPDDYSPPKYFCEQCKPADHKELLAAMERGEKPWEEARKQREELEAEKAAKKKGKKGGRKSTGRANEVQRTPTLEPEESVGSTRKRKLDDSPAPAPTGRSKKARSSLREDTEIASDTKDAQDAAQEDSLLTDVAKDAKEIDDATRSKIATGIIKSFEEQANTLASKGTLVLSKGETAKEIGKEIALLVEHAVYKLKSGGTGEPSDAYKEQIRAILNNVKSNPDLAARLMSRNLSPSEIATMDPRDMATEEQKQRDADEKMRMEKQHVLSEEKAPRIRRTHKGDEYIDESQQPAESATSNAPVRKQSTADQDVEMKSPTPAGGSEKPQPKRKASAAGTGKPFADPRRKSSSNFDIGRVWSGVQGSPTDGEAPKLPDGAQSSSPQPAGTAAAGADADVDRLLKDEENESEPYSPKEFVEEGVVWHGKVNGGSLGTFNAIAKFAAGCQPEVENLRMTWSEVIPPEIKLHGRIQPSKADDYLCGLEYSSTTELVIVSILEPKDSDEQREFEKFFSYLKQKDRYGVGSQHQVPAIKDIYLLPMDAGQPLPSVMKALEHNFPDPVTERMLLVPIVIKWTELPHNADRVRQTQQQQQSMQSPSVGPPVAQTPITPREPHAGFEASSYGQPAQGLNGSTHAQPTQAAGTPGSAHAPVRASISQNQGQAPMYALRVLGAEMAALPAVVDLVAQAPTAGESEFHIVKECLLENPEAGRSLMVLTRMLQEKVDIHRSAQDQANGQAQAPVSTQT